MVERCMCGDPDCSSCGPAQGYVPDMPDEDNEYERQRQHEIDNERGQHEA